MTALRNVTKKTRQSAFYKILISYIFVISIPLVIGIAWYAHMLHNLQEESEKVNASILKQVNILVDEQFNNVTSFTQSVNMNPYVNLVLNAKPPVNTETNYRMKDIAAETSNIRLVYSSCIDDYYIYFKNTQTILNDSAKFTPELFYSYVYNYQDVPYEEWRSGWLDNNDQRQLIRADIAGIRSAENELIYIKALSGGNKSRVDGKVVVHLNSQHFRDLLNGIKEVNNSVICIVTDEKEMLFTNNESGAAMISGISLEDKELKYDRKTWTVGNIKSESALGGINYLIFTPTERISYNWIITIAYIVFVLIFGTLLILYFTKKNYEPINKMVASFGGGTDADGKNEYHYIINCLNMIQQEKREMMAELVAQHSIVKESFIIKLLKGQIYDVAEIEQNAEAFGIGFGESSCRVDLLSGTFTQHSGEILDTVTNTMDQHKPANVIVSCVYTDGLVAVLFCAGEIQQLVACTRELWEAVFTGLAKSGNGDFSVGVGELQSSLRTASLSYSQAYEALEYRLINSCEHEILYYKEIAAERRSRYYYPLEAEGRITTCIRHGELGSAKEILHGIIDENFLNRTLSAEMLKCLIYDILSTFHKILWDMDIDLEAYQEGGKSLGDQLLSSKSAQEIKTHTDGIFELLSSHIEKNTAGSGRLKARIEAYIGENVSSCSFSLAQMADDLGVTPSHMSRYFKESFGENFNSYITKFRLERTKELLENGHLTIKEVGITAGYSDVNSFIRNFKRYTGVTPGQYRNNIKGK